MTTKDVNLPEQSDAEKERDDEINTLPTSTVLPYLSSYYLFAGLLFFDSDGLADFYRWCALILGFSVFLLSIFWLPLQDRVSSEKAMRGLLAGFFAYFVSFGILLPLFLR